VRKVTNVLMELPMEVQYVLHHVRVQCLAHTFLVCGV
jgi:hypothetical protein